MNATSGKSGCGTIEVEIARIAWAPRTCRTPSVDARPGLNSIAFLASLLGHVAITWGLLGNFAHPPRQPPVAGVSTPGASFFLDRATLVFIEEDGRATRVDRPAPRSLDAEALMSLDLRRIPIVIPELSELADAEGTTESLDATSQEGTDRRALLALYVGQIRARIERAWDRPSGSNDARCVAAIDQDLQGTVLNVDLGACQLPDSERTALLAAIRRASPLPAPPDTRVFMAHLDLDVTGYAATVHK